MVVDRLGPGGVRPAPELHRRRRAVVEAAAGDLHRGVRRCSGGAAPTLWVITARAGGLLALVAAYRLASLLVPRVADGRGWPAARRPRADRRGRRRRCSPRTGPTTCSAARPSRCCRRRAVGGRPAISPGATSSAFVLGVAASLIRPEAWPFIFLYGIWLWRREPRLRLCWSVARPARDPVLLVRAAVDRHRPAVPRRDPRQGLQRPPRRAPVHRGARGAASTSRLLPVADRSALVGGRRSRWFASPATGWCSALAGRRASRGGCSSSG